MAKFNLVLLAALPIALVVAACGQVGVDTQDSALGPTALSEPASYQYVGDGIEVSPGLRL